MYLKLLRLDRNTWNHITVCQIFFIKNSYLKVLFTKNYYYYFLFFSLKWHSPDKGYVGRRCIFTCGVSLGIVVRKWSPDTFVSEVEFSFSQTGCHTKVKQPGLSNCLPIAGGNTWIHAFPKGICAEVKRKRPRPGFEFASLCPFPTTVTVRPRASIHSYITAWKNDWH